METNFDFSQTYYKVTNKNECHHGYQYKDGLNILKEKFNDDSTASCCAGGFYFTDYENLPRFFEYGTWIREVTIPEDAKVVKDPEGDKWRTDKIILSVLHLLPCGSLTTLASVGIVTSLIHVPYSKNLGKFS